jgi:hypothetical protein
MHIVIQILRTIAALFVGGIVGYLAIWAGHWPSGEIYPLPEGTNPDDLVALRQILPTMPLGAFIAVLLYWQAGAFFGGATAALIGGKARCWHSAAIGLFVLAGTVMMIIKLPHPDWMIVAGLLLPLPVSIGAGKLVGIIFPQAPPPTPRAEGTSNGTQDRAGDGIVAGDPPLGRR